MIMKLDKTGKQTNKTEKWLSISAVCLLIVLVLPSTNYITTSLLHLGFVSHHESTKDKLIQLGQEIIASPNRYLESDSEMPLLKVDVNYQDWQVLAQDRALAFETGMIAEKRHMVNGVIHYKGDAYKTKLRLQGDALEHIVGAKRWSLRFDLKNNKSILNNKRFALLSSNVRIHQGPYLFAQTLVKSGFDIISPQMNPVKVVVNGVNWGVMLMEETFGQDLLSFNQRKQGLVVRLDILKETSDSEGHISRIFQPRAIQRTSVLRDPELNRHRMIALSLISDFFEGKRVASDVFDYEKLGQYLASIDVWSAWHALSWNNWRWYYNPVTAKLEPIQSDVAVTPAKHYWLTQAVSKEFPVAKKMLTDTKVKAAYDNALAIMLTQLDNGEMQSYLEEKQSDRLKKLHHGMPLINDFDFDIMHQQTQCLTLGYQGQNCKNIPKLDSQLHLHLTHFSSVRNWDLASHFYSKKKNPKTNYLALINTSLEDLHIHAIEGINHLAFKETLEIEGVELPLVLKPNEQRQLKISQHITDLILHAAVTSKKIVPFYFKRDLDPLAPIQRMPMSQERVSQVSTALDDEISIVNR